MYFWVLIGVLLLLVLLGSRSGRVGKFVSYHVINLDRSPDRLAAFNARAVAAGFPPVERWRAADTKKITRDETIAQNISGWLYDRAEKRKAFGMIGATISHRELLRYLATLPAADTDLHVVFEDDAAIPSDFFAKWAAVTPYVPADYDMIYFGWLFPNMHKVAGPICAANPAWLNNGHVGNTGVNAYAVRHGALPKILDHVAFSHTAFDNMISEKATTWGVYYCNPQIVPQDSDLGSTIVGV
jgi:GR25 family glycosyltransferase involved in LPS biosynthesis